jgi:hypothetical protein
VPHCFTHQNRSRFQWNKSKRTYLVGKDTHNNIDCAAHRIRRFDCCSDINFEYVAIVLIVFVNNLLSGFFVCGKMVFFAADICTSDRLIVSLLHNG